MVGQAGVEPALLLAPSQAAYLQALCPIALACARDFSLMTVPATGVDILQISVDVRREMGKLFPFVEPGTLLGPHRSVNTLTLVGLSQKTP